MRNSKNRIDIVPFIAMLSILVLMGFVFRRFAFVFFMTVLMAMLIGGVYFFIKYWRDQRENRAFENSLEGTISKNLEFCEDQIIKNEQEMIEIQDNIIELKNSLDDKMETNESAMYESEMLIKGFERELSLRKSKLEFYKICKEKIKNIQYNQQLAQKLADKKERLKQLQEDHFEDLAEMERLKSNMDYNKTYVDTIDSLSLRMLESTSLSSAQELHDELILITKELRDL